MRRRHLGRPLAPAFRRGSKWAVASASAGTGCACCSRPSPSWSSSSDTRSSARPRANDPVPDHRRRAAAVAAPVAQPCPTAGGGVLRTAPHQDGQRTVALTFDDGPGDWTDDVLAVLAHEDVKATFFVVGREAAAAPDQVRQLLRRRPRGGEPQLVASRRPGRSGRWNSGLIGSQIRRTSTQITDVTGQPPCYFRPPQGVVPGAERPRPGCRPDDRPLVGGHPRLGHPRHEGGRRDPHPRPSRPGRAEPDRPAARRRRRPTGHRGRAARHHRRLPPAATRSSPSATVAPELLRAFHTSACRGSAGDWRTNRIARSTDGAVEHRLGARAPRV